ncbi:MAG: MFS transporter, partial [Peptococcaceae bacterium]|nr:MFS transporter [Peptococcaceae bacterium]
MLRRSRNVCRMNFSSFSSSARTARHHPSCPTSRLTSVSMALIKDCYSGKTRESILAVVQTVAGLAPMLAPVVGAFLLKFTDWRGSFWLLTAAGAVCLLLAILYQETLPADEKYEGSI